MATEADLQINPAVYDWTGRTIALLEKVLKVNIKLHHQEGQVAAGEIFLFNHFARFETFIPQYLIYRETGAFSRSVAASDFFGESDPFSRYLLSLGAVPNDHPDLLRFLAEEVLRGRKVIVFPEGGMVKDRRVLDSAGRYGVYSRTAKERRKHHTGAAVVALSVDGFKTAVLEAEAAGRQGQLEDWTETLGLDGVEALVATARRETLIVPSNITFYPIRITENVLQRGAELFSKGLSPRAAEEFLIEGNILLRDTDMDIRLGDPVRPSDFMSRWDQALRRRVARRAPAIDSFLTMGSDGRRWDERLWGRRMRRKALRIRDAYMVEMYAGATINLSHLASRIILRLLDQGVKEVGVDRFHVTLYLAVKALQPARGVHLHRSLRNPETYQGLARDECPGLKQLMEMATASELLERADGSYRFLPKLFEEHGFDEVRIENPIAVYANEAEPIPEVNRAVESAIRQASKVQDADLAELWFDDELRTLNWDREAFHKLKHEDVNRDETATASGEPFLLLPEKGRKDLGVVLVHGFTASPAEVRPLGDRLSRLGYPVLGVRLKGHGTSPWDLLERTWEDWLVSLRRGYEILSVEAQRICLVGFSAGGALSLCLASELPPGLAGVVAVAAPVKLRDKAMTFVPLVHGANVLLDSVSAGKGVKLFHHSNAEHPDINYRHMPIRALYELGRLIHEMENHLSEVQTPVLIIQGTGDPTVDPKSADKIYQGLGTDEKTLVMIPSERHGILYEDIGGTHRKIVDFLEVVEGEGGG